MLMNGVEETCHSILRLPRSPVSKLVPDVTDGVKFKFLQAFYNYGVECD